MLNRRKFLKTTLQGSSLLALGSVVPQFVVNTAEAAKPGEEKILVIVELTGGNDGLNTVIPFNDDLYHKARPTLRLKKDEVLALNDDIGLHPSLGGLQSLFEENQLAVVQGVGYPNPNRSHFESMDIWHTADPSRGRRDGWLGRTLHRLPKRKGRIPAFHIGLDETPLAMHGAVVPTLHPNKPLDLNLGTGQTSYEDREYYSGEVEQLVNQGQDPNAKRRELIRDLTGFAADSENPLLGFVQKSSLQAYATIDQLKEILSSDFVLPQGDYNFNRGRWQMVREGLAYELQLVAHMIRADLGTRVYYVSIDGFDTHSDQKEEHAGLLEELGNAIEAFFAQLSISDDQSRVLVMSFSEFGRRVQENGSKGTDHGAAAPMFLCGPAVKGGLIGEHPSLKPADLDFGDLRYHTDFRQVYATVLEKWLGCDSRQVLGGDFAPLPLLG